MDNYNQVLLQMAEFGIELLDKNLPLKIDTPKRVTCGKWGKDWYRLYTFRPDAGGTYVVGTYGTYRHGGDWRKVQVDWAPLSEAERSRMDAERTAARAAQEAQRREEAALAALGAADLLASAQREGHSPYLERKQVAGESCRYLSDGTVVIPLMRYDLPRDQRLQAVDWIVLGQTSLKFIDGQAISRRCCWQAGIAAKVADRIDSGNAANLVGVSRIFRPVVRH